ncbi:hypothetical protein SAMN04488029_3748 [Reichenbachiella faecimaris]|uniref:Uncharacterized protein n=1 Tax=Reichenbachiella faecimaris TaxID=692418 RepID=A0A1W2GPQ2_REIFA|nr:hypothetical protein [Reichenbachiella faecimaris]SMD38328.1 hypothetical protein SAMN04488029_3748 [Reichenbachiella faecimaris]
MNINRKICVCVLTLMLSVGTVSAQSSLTQLPFGIVIGQTTNEEIEDRGTCIKQVEERDGSVRCEKYDIAGNFTVMSSQNEVVNKVSFDGTIGNQLPRIWQELGLEFGGQNNSGTLEIDFRNIIKANGATYINTSIIYKDKEEDGILFKFEIEGLKYEATVITNSSTTNRLGLKNITITESY